jgi:hypothetical protein
VTVVLLGLGSVLAAWLMLRLGLLLGPPEPGAVIRHVPTGGHAALQLKPLVHGVWLVWPIATMVGAAAVLFVLTPTPIDDDVTMTEPGEP